MHKKIPAESHYDYQGCSSPEITNIKRFISNLKKISELKLSPRNNLEDGVRQRSNVFRFRVKHFLNKAKPARQVQNQD
jgi:hypothetical protein